jgi:prepilin-type N-terminal cleavage/methylation domain-containing protein/prepilin-type processing-associated H-X9-DG protein
MLSQAIRCAAGRAMTVRRGMTIIELLVVIAIIGLLIAMLLPAVQAARESSRRTECVNHLKQIGLGLASHADRTGHYPSSGWGWAWPPYPGRGDGEKQPGSWVYCILPCIEQEPLWENNMTNDQRLAIPLPLFYCPTRRSAGIYPLMNFVVQPPQLPLMAKSDYAACAGDHDNPNAPGPTSPYVQPDTLAQGDDPAWWQSKGIVRDATGIIFQRSSVRLGDVRDGLSHTYAVGEKLLDPAHYTDGAGLGDLESVYHGDNDDTSRVVCPIYGGLMRDTWGLSNRNIFGGPHPGGVNFAFADGSVHTINYEIDVELHRRLGNRQDRLPAEIP